MSTEIHENIAATLDGRIDIKARYTACGACGHVTIFGQNDGRAEIDFRES